MDVHDTRINHNRTVKPMPAKSAGGVGLETRSASRASAQSVFKLRLANVVRRTRLAAASLGPLVPLAP